MPFAHPPLNRLMRRPAMAVALACVLWLAQTLGLLHRELHDPLQRAAAPATTVVAANAATAADAALAPGGRGLLAELLARWAAQHADAKDCRLFDQACGAELAPVADATPVVATVAGETPQAVPACATVARTAPYQARAPPRG